MHQDYTVDCDSANHQKFEIFAYVMLLVYPVAIPLGTGYLLWRSRHGINPPSAKSEADAITTRSADPEIAPFRELFSPYRPHLYLFEVVEMYRRLIMTGALVFVRGQRTRAVIGLTLSLFFALVYENTSPYVSTPLNALSVSSVWLLVLVYGGGMMLIGRPCGFSDAGLGWFLLVAVVADFSLATALQFDMTLRHRSVLTALKTFGRAAPEEERNNQAKKRRNSSLLRQATSVFARHAPTITYDDSTSAFVVEHVSLPHDVLAALARIEC